LNQSQFYSFKTYISLGEIDYDEAYEGDYKNTSSRNWLDSPNVFNEKKASLLLPQ
jgi:hypothetical protein